MSGSGDVTLLLTKAAQGDAAASQGLLPLVYDELRRLASAYFRSEPKEHTLQPTALVHEAYLKLVQRDRDWDGRRHFFGVAAQAMRRILVDHARGRRAVKRGGARPRFSLDEVRDVPQLQDDYVVALDSALERLSTFDPQLSRIVELRYFAGMTIEEIAEVLEISTATVKREWAVARGWLHREISKENLD